MPSSDPSGEVSPVLPESLAMIQMLSGFQVSQALYVVAKLGVATVLADGPRDGHQLHVGGLTGDELSAVVELGLQVLFP